MTQIIYCEEKDMFQFMRPMHKGEAIRGECPGCRAILIFYGEICVCWKCRGTIKILNLVAPDAAMSVGAGGQRMAMHFYKN